MLPHIAKALLIPAPSPTPAMPLSPLRGAHRTPAASAFSPPPPLTKLCPWANLRMCRSLRLPSPRSLSLFKSRSDVSPRRRTGLFPCVLFTQTHSHTRTHVRVHTCTHNLKFCKDRNLPSHPLYDYTLSIQQGTWHAAGSQRTHQRSKPTET